MGKSRFVLAALTLASVSLLALSVGTATAGRLSVSSQTFRVAWSRFEFIESEEPATVCPVTLEGSLHARTFAKVARALVGYITRASVGTCSAGEARVLTETLPWHLRYSSFTGTLPNITRVRLELVGFEHLISSVFGFHRCLYIFPRESPGGLILNLGVGGVVQSAAIDELREHLLLKEELSLIFCRALLGVRGTGTMTALNSSARITMTLI